MIKITIIVLTIFLAGELFSQNTHVLKSNYLPTADSILVFTPNDYNHQKDYPLVILLHGYSGDYKSWNRITPLQNYADKYQFIIVCPDGLYDSWYINSSINIQYENFFFMKLIPYIFRSYSIDKKNLFITGLSMGGFGAAYLYTTHPKLFKTFGSTSGLMEPDEYFEDYNISHRMGKKVEYYSIPQRIKNADLKYKAIIDCGTSDPFYDQNIYLKTTMEQEKIPVLYYESDGTHNRDYWKRSIIKHFEHFYSLVNK